MEKCNGKFYKNLERVVEAKKSGFKLIESDYIPEKDKVPKLRRLRKRDRVKMFFKTLSSKLPFRSHSNDSNLINNDLDGKGMTNKEFE